MLCVVYGTSLDDSLAVSSPSTVSGGVDGDRDVFYCMFDFGLAPVGLLFHFLHLGKHPHWQSLCSWLSHSYHHVFQKLATSSTLTLPNLPLMSKMLACYTVPSCGLCFFKKASHLLIMPFFIIQSREGLFSVPCVCEQQRDGC